MASIDNILKNSDGSFQKAEQIALQAVANGKHEFWLDLALILSVQGKFTGARQAQSKYLEHFPDCPRVRFGMAPFALADGELQAGLRLLERGREIQCWGGVAFNNTTAPLWTGEQSIAGKTLLLYGEGGLGDEVIGMRAVRWAEERGAKCIIACSKELMRIAASTGASAVIDYEFTNAVHYDYWLPSMSAPRLFNRTWETLSPGKYIHSADQNLNKAWDRIVGKSKLNVGLRWQGNPRFEHEQLRRFDPQLLFRATEGDAALWSLQKDAQMSLPDDICDLEPFLSTWEHTVAAIQALDLVITSCTSIAHVAGAMGKPTWVIVPVMSYYCWAENGDRSSWYPSVKVYRQECYGNWDAPFKKIQSDLSSLIKGKS